MSDELPESEDEFLSLPSSKLMGEREAEVVRGDWAVLEVGERRFWVCWRAVSRRKDGAIPSIVYQNLEIAEKPTSGVEKGRLPGALEEDEVSEVRTAVTEGKPAGSADVLDESCVKGKAEVDGYGSIAVADWSNKDREKADSGVC